MSKYHLQNQDEHRLAEVKEANRLRSEVLSEVFRTLNSIRESALVHFSEVKIQPDPVDLRYAENSITEARMTYVIQDDRSLLKVALEQLALFNAVYRSMKGHLINENILPSNDGDIRSLEADLALCVMIDVRSRYLSLAGKITDQAAFNQMTLFGKVITDSGHKKIVEKRAEGQKSREEASCDDEPSSVSSPSVEVPQGLANTSAETVHEEKPNLERFIKIAVGSLDDKVLKKVRTIVADVITSANSDLATINLEATEVEQAKLRSKSLSTRIGTLNAQSEAEALLKGVDSLIKPRSRSQDILVVEDVFLHMFVAELERDPSQEKMALVNSVLKGATVKAIG